MCAVKGSKGSKRVKQPEGCGRKEEKKKLREDYGNCTSIKESKILKEVLLQANAVSWVKFGRQMERKSEENQKLFYMVLK